MSFPRRTMKRGQLFLCLERESMRDRIMQFLDEPTTRLGRVCSLGMLVLIYMSVAQVVVEVRYPDFVAAHRGFFHALEYIVLGIFSLELAVRLICNRNRRRYVNSFYGVVDILAVAPGLAGLILPFPSETAWIRVFRILRFARISKAFRSGAVMGGVTGRLTPFLAMVLGLKGVMVALESEPWWPEIGDLNVIIGVVGFALAIMLGTKLRVVNTRLYALEDALCRIVGAVRDMQSNPAVYEPLQAWARHFEAVLFKPEKEAIREFRRETERLETRLEAAGIGGPNTAWFHRDVEYVLHRAGAMTRVVFERFLRHTTIAYTATVVLAVPGLTGFLSSILITYVLGGVYFIIDDMDTPLDFGENSYIDANLDPLTHFNTRHLEPTPSTSECEAAVEAEPEVVPTITV